MKRCTEEQILGFCSHKKSAAWVVSDARGLKAPEAENSRLKGPRTEARFESEVRKG